MRISILGLLLGLAACGNPANTQQVSEPSGYFDSYDSKWSERSLSVCWEADSHSINDLETYKAIVRNAVTKQYRRVGFAFTGWTSCDAVKAANIRIWVDPDTWPKVKTFGKNLNNMSRGMELTFDFLSAGNGWGAECQKEKNLPNCVRNYALHEFGHSLGLKHEADRSDSTCEQRTDSPGIDIGAYDSLSIMNYCNNETDVRANHYPVLSYNDVATLLHVYHPGPANRTFAAIAWSPSTGSYGTSWRWINQGAAENTAMGHCVQFSNRASDCRVMAWTRDSCAALAVGANRGYGWALNTDVEAAKSAALYACRHNDSGCKLLTAVCSKD